MKNQFALKNNSFLPLVIIRDEDILKDVYLGFVPGINMHYVIDKSIQTCKIKLKKFISEKIKNMLKNNEKFPIFPSKEEILQDFSNVIDIEMISLN